VSKNDHLDDLIGAVLMDDEGNTPFKSARVISAGSPYKCGPGFCASDLGLGFMGYCRGARSDIQAAPDCPICGAPHQGPSGCWLCLTRDGNDAKGTGFWLRCLEHGIDSKQVFDLQDARMRQGTPVSCDDALTEILETDDAE